jgi:hypothetical protein
MSGKKLALSVGCHNNEITPTKTKYLNKVIMFEETLKFKQTILLCYGR